jgi:hypothetical protein
MARPSCFRPGHLVVRDSFADSRRAFEVAMAWQHTARISGNGRHYQVAHATVMIALERYQRSHVAQLADASRAELQALAHQLRLEAVTEQSRAAIAASLTRLNGCEQPAEQAAEV